MQPLEPGKDQELSEHLRNLEDRYWQSLLERDVDTMVALTHEPCLVAGAQGVATLDRAAMRRMMTEQSTWELLAYELKDLHVHLVDGHTGLVGYIVWEKLAVEGKELELEAAETSVWVQRDGHWTCALHSESLLGDPFGRKR
jgi:hypothetical protein